jgi:RNA ligase
LNDLKKLEEDNKEGFVVRFEDGFRVKVKFSEYVRLHGILTNVSNLTIWEHLRNGFDFDKLLDRVPDEFYDWLKKTVIGLHKDYDDIEEQAWAEYEEIHLIKGGIDRKTFAIEALKTKHSGILFKMYDKNPYDEIIWKMIRPVYSKPFKDGYETP